MLKSYFSEKATWTALEQLFILNKQNLESILSKINSYELKKKKQYYFNYRPKNRV